jgi:hypothetical protein
VSYPELGKLVALAQDHMMYGAYRLLNLVVADKVAKFVAVMEARFLDFYQRGRARYYCITIIGGVSTVYRSVSLA